MVIEETVPIIFSLSLSLKHKLITNTGRKKEKKYRFVMEQGAFKSCLTMLRKNNKIDTDEIKSQAHGLSYYRLHVC